MVTIDRLASTSVHPGVVHANGDRASYLDLTFACSYVSGEAHVADDESIDVRWFARDAMPEMAESMVPADRRRALGRAGRPVRALAGPVDHVFQGDTSVVAGCRFDGVEARSPVEHVVAHRARQHVAAAPGEDRHSGHMRAAQEHLVA